MIPESATPPNAAIISVVIPVYNEAQNIVPCVQKLSAALQEYPHELLICYDFDEDSTLPALASMADRPTTIRLVKNTLGRGVAFALQAGFNAAHGDVVVTTMADLSDPPEVIPLMAAKIRAGADVVSGSRYMRGGSQHGGPLLKRTLSRLAGLSLHYVAGVHTHDATTNFRAYSAKFLHTHPIESTAGFEVAIELTAKAHLAGARIDEVPSSWHDRTAGESRFNLKKWLPKYLYWYFKVMARPLFIWGVLALMFFAWIISIHHYGTNWPFWDELSYLDYLVGANPITWTMLWLSHNGHQIILPKLIYFGVMKASGYQSLAVMYLDAFFLLLGTMSILLGLRAARGRMSLIDTAVVFAAFSFSQYQNFLWAFQLAFLISATLIFIIIAAAIAIRDRTDRRLILIIAAATALLPFCGGQGMGTAPGFFLWLLGVGVIYLIRPKNKTDRTFGIYSLASGIVAAAAWCISIYSLPPSPTAQSIRAALESWSAFISSLSDLWRTTIEFFSTPFLPESMDHSLPYFYSGRFWGFCVFLLFTSTVLILLIAWFRRPRERLRISALVACLVAFVMLTVILYLSRGVLGHGAGAVGRYSTVAMPLLVIIIVIYILYTPRLIRAAVPLAIAAATLFLLYGPHGNLEKMQDFTASQRAAYRDFKNELHRPGGTSFEELVGHFENALFAPGEARQVPEFIQLMADHRAGPFRGNHRMPSHISSWQNLPFEFQYAPAQSNVKWNGSTALKNADDFATLTFATTQPTPVSALRLTCTIKCPSVSTASIFIFDYLTGVSTGDPKHQVRWSLYPNNPESLTGIVYLFSTVDRIGINLGPGITEFNLLKIARLEPEPAPNPIQTRP